MRCKFCTVTANLNAELSSSKGFDKKGASKSLKNIKDPEMLKKENDDLRRQIKDLEEKQNNLVNRNFAESTFPSTNFKECQKNQR